MKRAFLLVIAFSAILVAGPFPNDDETIEHVLNRIAFGPRQGDIERVRAIGVDRYIDQQLHPERLADAGMATRLSGLASIGMSSREIAQVYELPQLQARYTTPDWLARNRGRRTGPSSPRRPGSVRLKVLPCATRV